MFRIFSRAPLGIVWVYVYANSLNDKKSNVMNGNGYWLIRIAKYRNEIEIQLVTRDIFIEIRVYDFL